MMDLLAKHGADVNARITGTLSFSFHTGYGNQNDGVNSKEGTSALHEAARNGQLDLVKHLIDLGADPNLKDGDWPEAGGCHRQGPRGTGSSAERERRRQRQRPQWSQ